jgi:hypothetical protein
MTANGAFDGSTSSFFQISCQGFDPPLFTLAKRQAPNITPRMRYLLGRATLRFINLGALPLPRMILGGIIGVELTLGWFGIEDNVSENGVNFGEEVNYSLQVSLCCNGVFPFSI